MKMKLSAVCLKLMMFCLLGMTMVAIADDEQQTYEIQLTVGLLHPTLHQGAYRSIPFFSDRLLFDAASGDTNEFHEIISVRLPGTCQYLANVNSQSEPFQLAVEVKHKIPRGKGDAVIKISSPGEDGGWQVSDDAIHVMIGPGGGHESRGMIYVLPDDISQGHNCSQIELEGQIQITSQ